MALRKLSNVFILLAISSLLSSCYRYCEKNSFTGTGFSLKKYDSSLGGITESEILSYDGPLKGNKNFIYAKRIKKNLTNRFSNSNKTDILNELNRIGFSCNSNECYATIKYTYTGKCNASEPQKNLDVTDTIQVKIIDDEMNFLVTFNRYSPKGLVIYDSHY